MNLPDDFDREAICRSIAEGVRQAMYEAMNDVDSFNSRCPRDAITDGIEDGVRRAIIDIMEDARPRDILTAIREGLRDAAQELSEEARDA